jgi:hypothetical protein
MHDGREPPALPPNGAGKRSDEWGAVGKDARFLRKLCQLLAKMSEGDRKVLLSLAQKIIREKDYALPEVSGSIPS